MAGSSSPPLSDSLESCDSPEDDPSKNKNTGAESGKQRKRFHPLRVVRNMFRRTKRQGSEDDPQLHTSTSKKSRSTSELSTTSTVHGTSPTGESHLGYGAVGGLLLHPGSSGAGMSHGMHAGLSVSHDSIFASDHTIVSPGTSLHNPGEPGQQGSALSVPHVSGFKGLREELRSRFRNRRDSDDEDDPGLPRSPCTSPTTADILSQGLKDKSSKSHSTCSAGSLISMCSSENDEDLVGMYSSSHSSSRRSADFDGEFEECQPVPLNHEAAMHKMAVRPKRTHGLPRHRRMQQMALAGVGQSLPATPEVTEDSSLPQASAATVLQEGCSTLEDLDSSSEILEPPMKSTPTTIFCADVTAEALTPMGTDTVTMREEPEAENDSQDLSESTPEHSNLISETSKSEVAENKEQSPPVVKSIKGKSKSAELKLRHEIKQFSKRQQEKMKDTASSGDELCDETLDHQVREREHSMMSDTKVEDELACSYIEDDFANGNVDRIETVIVPDIVPQDDITRRKNEEVPESSVKEPHENLEADSVMETNDQTSDECGIFHAPVQEDKVSAEVIKTEMIEEESSQTTSAEPAVEEANTIPQYVLESVVLRNPALWVPEKSFEKSTCIPEQEKVIEKSDPVSDPEEMIKVDPDCGAKPVETAFSSNDFDGIMKKRRSMTDSCNPNAVTNSIPNRPISDSVAKPVTPSKRFSVEIATFDQRAKEQILKQDNSRDIQNKVQELAVNVNKTPDVVPDPSPPCAPVTIRIRRGMSLVERYSESSSDAQRPEVKNVEKPLVRPRSQLLNQGQINGKVPEFMKIQLRSSREELDTKPEPPQWEVKIQPQLQKNQARQNVGSSSLPYHQGKPVSSDVKYSDPKEVSKVGGTRECKIENSQEKVVQIDCKPEIQGYETPFRPEEKQIINKPGDITKCKRNLSSENKENVASSNVQYDAHESRVLTEESKQDGVVSDKLPVVDIRRKSFVQPKDSEECEPELLRVFARRSYKQKSSEKVKKEEAPKAEVKQPVKLDAISIPKLETKCVKQESSRIPVKPKSDPKASFSEHASQKQEDILKSVPKEQNKFIEKHSTPVKIHVQTSELLLPKPNTVVSSPKTQSPDVIPPKPEYRESLSSRTKSSELTDNEVDKSNPRGFQAKNESMPNKPTTRDMPVFTPSKLDRRESSSFKVKSSNSIGDQSLQSKGNDQGRNSEPLASTRPQLAATKRSDFVKMASVDSPGTVKDNDNSKDAPTWLQLAQQRREKREQKERLLYGQNSNSFLLEGNSKPSRNSKVLDLVNNFQKLQTT